MTAKEFVIGLRRAAIATMVGCILGVPFNFVMGLRVPNMGRTTDYAILIVFWIIGFVVFGIANRRLREMSGSN